MVHSERRICYDTRDVPLESRNIAYGRCLLDSLPALTRQGNDHMTIEIVLDDGTTYMWANVPEETLDAIHTAIGSDPDTERS